MTVIVAASWDGQAFIGCDQAGTDGWGVQGEHGVKLHRAPFGWLGYTGSYRTIQAIHRHLRKVTAIDGEEGMEELVSAIEEGLKSAGWSKSCVGHLPRCEDLTLLVATWAGDLWTVQSDLAFLRHRHFAAVGSGYQVALGALHTNHGFGAAPAVAAGCALAAACDVIATCAGPAPVQRVDQEGS